MCICKATVAMAKADEGATASLLRSGEADGEGSSSSRAAGNGGPSLFKNRSLRSRSWRAPFHYHWATVENAFQDNSDMSAGMYICGSGVHPCVSWVIDVVFLTIKG